MSHEAPHESIKSDLVVDPDSHSYFAMKPKQKLFFFSVNFFFSLAF
jgi:hypothetical protein